MVTVTYNPQGTSVDIMMVTHITKINAEKLLLMKKIEPHRWSFHQYTTEERDFLSGLTEVFADGDSH